MITSSWLCHGRARASLGLLSLVIGSLIGCQSSPPMRDVVSRPSSSTVTSAVPEVPSNTGIAPKQKPVMFSLSLDNPASDLKVTQGDFIRKGQVIADRSQQRLELETQKRTLEAQLNAISTRGTVSFSTKAEEENIALAKAQLDAAQTALRDYEKNSPWTDFARSNLPLAEDEVELARLQKNLKQAQRNVEEAQAKFSEKQSAIGNFQNEQISAKAAIQQQLSKIEQKIASLKPIQSSYSGTITKIDVAKAAATPQPTKVLVTLMPGDSPQLVPPSGEFPQEALDGSLPRDETSLPSGSASDLLPPSIPIPDPSLETPGSTPSLNPTVE